MTAFFNLFLGEQDEVGCLLAEDSKYEDQLFINLWYPSEENPRVQKATLKYTSHNLHVQQD